MARAFLMVDWIGRLCCTLANYRNAFANSGLLQIKRSAPDHILAKAMCFSNDLDPSATRALNLFQARSWRYPRSWHCRRRHFATPLVSLSSLDRLEHHLNSDVPLLEAHLDHMLFIIHLFSSWNPFLASALSGRVAIQFEEHYIHRALQ